MNEVHVRVPDMSCGHCVSAIQRAVEGVEGVQGVEASLDMKIVIIKSENNLDHDVILSAVRGAGYTPELIS
jgi:copper chaperone